MCSIQNIYLHEELHNFPVKEDAQVTSRYSIAFLFLLVYKAAAHAHSFS